MQTVKVRVPGTTANCGPGFDAVGIACTIYNELELTLMPGEGIDIEVYGEGSVAIPKDDRNIAYQAVKTVLKRVNAPSYAIKIRMWNNIPMARGLGSSAAAIVAGLTAANTATGNTLSKQEILEIATAIEGHPDNVAPAIYGGVSVSAMEGDKVHSLRFTPAGLRMVVAVPEFGLSTKSARQVLPRALPFKDAIFNISRAALFVAAIAQGEYHLLRHALEDKVHQPYREKLIPGMQAVFAAAKNAGAYGAAISGAGSCLIAFTDSN
ncbi:MAG: homoserine kinase, partial [Negativicutes bacterium]|nr:homoserine kinase [Negativicutes bacterium]